MNVSSQRTPHGEGAAHKRHWLTEVHSWQARDHPLPLCLLLTLAGKDSATASFQGSRTEHWNIRWKGSQHSPFTLSQPECTKTCPGSVWRSVPGLSPACISPPGKALCSVHRAEPVRGGGEFEDKWNGASDLWRGERALKLVEQERSVPKICTSEASWLVSASCDLVISRHGTECYHFTPVLSILKTFLFGRHSVSYSLQRMWADSWPVNT